MNNFNTKVAILKSKLHIIDNSRDSIIQRWVNDEDVDTILLSHGIEKTFFAHHYAHPVLGYYIDVIKGTQVIGNCPVIVRLFEYFKEKNITSSELFVICTHFRKAMIAELFAQNIMSDTLYEAVSFVFDANFRGLLEQFNETIYTVKQESWRHENLFTQFNAAIGENALVSRSDTKGIITYANDKFVTISGYSREELMGKAHNIVRHPDVPKAFFQNLWSVISEGDVFKGVIKNRAKDGSAYYVDATILPLIDLNGKIVEYLAIRYEVTNLVEARNTALKAEKAKDDFLANMSHEIRTPLNAILGFVHLLLKRDQDTQNREYLETIASSGQTLLEIISDILDFAKIKNDKISIDPQAFEPHIELQKLTDLFSSIAIQKEIDYRVNFEPSLPFSVKADALRIKQILSNMLSNAFKFTDTNGNVEVHIGYCTPNLVLSVKDNGIGMSKEQMQRIFNPFEQAEMSTTKKYGGTGLGLSICSKLAKMMGGDILVESQPDEGSRFEAILPVELLQETHQTPANNEEALYNEETSQFIGNILVAEDNKTNAQLIMIILDDFGLDVVIAENGKIAAETFKKNSFDMVLMDQQMPVMNGIESTHAILEYEIENGLKHTPIIALTANAVKGDRERFIQAGMDDYLQKPIEQAELQRVLKKYLLSKNLL
ncbi:MAG: ATP-binding protein [Campylobacterota bacterium]|nr:ATP-binding protein [Campylobacterota bacterium]